MVSNSEGLLTLLIGVEISPELGSHGTPHEI